MISIQRQSLYLKPRAHQCKINEKATHAFPWYGQLGSESIFQGEYLVRRNTEASLHLMYM